MKFFAISVAVAMLLTSESVEATQLRSIKKSEIEEQKLDEATKASVKKAAAAALKVAVAAKKAESQESIKSDMKAVHKAEKKEDADLISEMVDKAAQDEEKKAVERAVAHVEKIRQQKLTVHNTALKEIESIKQDAQKKHDEINKATKEASDKAISKAAAGVLGLDGKK